jgi:diguanylate cyclase (GGDEF)-like protein
MDSATYRTTALINLAIACIGASAVVGSYETINANLRRTIALERTKFRYLAGHDILTQLPNRRLFMELQETALRRADRTKQKVGLFLIDLDDFKRVNDRFGHPAGDRMLQTVGGRLRRFLRVTDAVARLGGDEFAVLVELLDSRDDARVFAERLQSELSGDVEIGTGLIGTVAASIGVALYPDDGDTVEELHEAADAAMYAAKQQGGGTHRFAESAHADDPFFSRI